MKSLPGEHCHYITPVTVAGRAKQELLREIKAKREPFIKSRATKKKNLMCGGYCSILNPHWYLLTGETAEYGDTRNTFIYHG